MPGSLPGRFRGEVVLLTGASRGIGLATTRALASEGAALVLGARGSEDLEAAAAEARTLGVDVVAVPGDVRTPETLEALLAAAESLGGPDVLIHNVGGGTDGKPVEDVSDEEWSRDLELNLSCAFRITRAVVPAMRSRSRGRIVHVSSVAGRSRGNLSGVAYAAAKAGLQGMTRQLAWDLGPHGITVNAIAPGLTRTPRAEAKWDRLEPADRERILARVALGRWGTPEEVARAILFLASADAAYVTGATLDVNGGMWMC